MKCEFKSMKTETLKYFVQKKKKYLEPALSIYLF